MNYAELQKADVKVQRMVYGWAFKFGPLLVRPDIHDRTRRRVINYYWNRRYILTSSRWYPIVLGKPISFRRLTNGRK